MGGQIEGYAEQVLVPGEGDSEWYVFRTRPRREKKAAELFADMDLRILQAVGVP